MPGPRVYAGTLFMVFSVGRGLDPSAETWRLRHICRLRLLAADYTIKRGCRTRSNQVTNIVRTIEELKEKGIWFVCADMGGETMYDLDLTGPMGLVIGNEGEGVSRLVREACDFTASIPMKGDIDSLNASVAAGVLAYEIVRQRLAKAGK